MGFGENLRTKRRKKNISQEELAGKLNVSRQAISRWEQDNGYPEMEKMISLSKILNVTLDYLVSDNETADGSNEDSGSEEQPQISVSSAAAPTGRIMIRSYDGKQLVNCYKVISMHVSGSADTPNYVLYGVDSSSFWGENREMLGWYADEESVQKETADILAAIETGKPSYDLKYAAKVKKRFLSVELVKEERKEQAT